jgi:uncharacterized protein YjeT (DUF2065 family)
MARWGLIFAIFGLLYLVKPDIYRRWFWKKTDVFQQIFSPANYILFMRISGAVILVVGIILLIAGKFKI